MRMTFQGGGRGSGGAGRVRRGVARPRSRPGPSRVPAARAAPLAFACLGSSGAVPTATRDTTALLLRAGRTLCLIDVGGSPVQKLRRLSVDPLDLTAVVVTHTHPDHVYGLPALVQSLKILGRQASLPVYCRVEHVEQVRTLLEMFRLVGPGNGNGLDVPVVGVEPREEAPVFETTELTVTASPNAHGPMPNLAIRARAGDRSLVYSPD